MIIWFGMKITPEENESVKQIAKNIRDGTYIFDAPDFLMITDTPSFLKITDDKENILLNEEY